MSQVVRLTNAKRAAFSVRFFEADFYCEAWQEGADLVIELLLLYYVRGCQHSSIFFVRRVLFTVHKFFPEHRAGTEVLTLKIARELQSRGYEIKIITANPPDTNARYREGEDTKDYTYEGIDVHSIEEPLRLKENKFSHEFENPLIGAHFKKIIDSWQPDLVHVMHAQNLSASIIEESVRADVPVFLSPTDFWYICPVVQLKRPDGAVCDGPGPAALKCLTCYTPELFPAEEEFGEALGRKSSLFSGSGTHIDLLRRIAYSVYIGKKLPQAIGATLQRPAVLRRIANLARAVMVPTRLMKDMMIRNGIEESLIRHLPFGIDTSGLTGHERKVVSAELRIGYIGTIYEHKGLDLLIRAFQAMVGNKNARLKIYGSKEQFPDYFQEVQRLVESQPEVSKRIDFLGTFPNDRLGSIFEEIDFLVVPSRWYENTPLVMQSALATKTPLVATDLGGMSELIDDGVNGRLFPLNDWSSLSSILDELAFDKSLLEKYRANIGKTRTIEEMVDDIERIYAEGLVN